jgi:hypothetical protein
MTLMVTLVVLISFSWLMGSGLGCRQLKTTSQYYHSGSGGSSCLVTRLLVQSLVSMAIVKKRSVVTQDSFGTRVFGHPL